MIKKIYNWKNENQNRIKKQNKIKCWGTKKNQENDMKKVIKNEDQNWIKKQMQ